MGDRRRPVQFGLRTLLLVVSLTAAALGFACWLGPEVVPFEAAAVGVWLTARTRGRHLLVWLVPILWSASAFGSWHHPGDEYGMFIVSVLPAAWIAFFLQIGRLSDVYLPLIAAGIPPMAALGFALDRLPISRRLWAAVYIAGGLGWFAWGLLQFPSLEAATAKNGSISSYAYCAANLGLYVSLLLFLVGGAIIWLGRLLFSSGRSSTTDRAAASSGADAEGS